MAITAHVYQIYLAATPDQVWQAITDSAWTVRYLHSTTFVEPPVAGQPYRTVVPDRSAVDGVIEVMQPPGSGMPGRFVQTWHVLYDDAMSAEPPGRVEWTVEEAGVGLTRVRLVHGDLAASPLTWANVKDGWPWVLSALKSVVETGRSLPAKGDGGATEATGSEEGRAGDGAWHRRQAVEANNATWDLVESVDLDADGAEDLLRGAYAAAYHWQRAAGALPANEARASYLIAKAWLRIGQPDRALEAADRCLAVCSDHGLEDFDLAYGLEAKARALTALGRDADTEGAWANARSVPIADSEDRAQVERDLAAP